MASSIASEPIVDGAWPGASSNLTAGVTIPYVGGPPAQANAFDNPLATPAVSASAGTSGALTVPAGFRAGSFEDDWYYRVHVIPSEIDLGNLLSPQVRTFNVWNAHFVPRTLSSIAETLTEGLVLTRPGGAPSEPAVYGALIELVYTLAISQEGPPVIDAKYTLNFNTPETPILLVVGSRVVAFPFSCQAPVQEALEWVTDVHESYDGHEKRVQARELPRQLFEMSYLSGDKQEVANIRNSLIGNMGLVFGVPMWQEARPLLANAAAGATSVIVTTTDADFRGGVSELAMLWKSSRNYETIEVQTVNAGSLALARPTIAAFTAGDTMVVPVRLCFIEDAPGDVASQHGPAEFRIRWKGTRVTDLSESDGNLTLYLGSPVIQDTNHVDGLLGEQFAAKFFDIDSGSGVLLQTARRDVPEVSTQKTWMFENAAGSFKLRKLLYALRGRQRSFWLPTFRHDFLLAAQIGSSATNLEVLPVEYGRFVSEQPPFNHIAIYLNNGTVFFRQVTGHGTAGSNETISINSALGQVVNPSDVRFICFLVRSRLASDRVQIEHRRLGAVTVSVPIVGVIQ